MLLLLHAKWVVEKYEYLKEQKEPVIKGFEKSGIMEVVKSAQDIHRRSENPFDDGRRKQNINHWLFAFIV